MGSKNNRTHKKHKKQTKQEQFEQEFIAYNKFLISVRSKPISREEFKRRLRGTVARPKQRYTPPPQPAWHRPSAADNIKSLESKRGNTDRRSMTDAHSLALSQESDATKEAILKRAKQIGPAYNKGAYQVITDSLDLSSMSRKK